MNRSLVVMIGAVMWGVMPVMAGDMAPAQEAPAAATESMAAEAKSALSAEIKIGTAVENKAVVGEAEKFPAETTQLAGWTRITGAAEPTQITHVWKLNGKEVGTVTLPVGGTPYRTYTRKTVMGPGIYALEVHDASGNVIGSKEVEVQAPSAAPAP